MSRQDRCCGAESASQKMCADKSCTPTPVINLGVPRPQDDIHRITKTDQHPGPCCESEQIPGHDIEATCKDKRGPRAGTANLSVPAGAAACLDSYCGDDTTPVDCGSSKNDDSEADKCYPPAVVTNTGVSAALGADDWHKDGPTSGASCKDKCCVSGSDSLEVEVHGHCSQAEKYLEENKLGYPNSSWNEVRKKSFKRRNHNSCASTVFGRFYEVACCCVPNNVQRKIPAASKKETINDPSFKFNSAVSDGRRDINQIERSGNNHTLPMMMSVQGMDCQSCATRVTKALLTIPSVENPKVNTFSGQVVLTYEAGTITPEAIARRTATLTGFRCEVRSITGAVQQKRIALQVRATNGLQDAKLPLGVVMSSMQRHESGGAIVEVNYDSWIIQPRSVVDAFAPWSAAHIPRSSTRETDEARTNLMALLRRTVISIICCIPVLVLSWAPIPRRPIVYGWISLLLTTVIQLYVAGPLYSSAFRSLFLQRIMDMDLLVVISTSVAYIFSVIAFGMEVAHHPSLGNFFETSSLLVTLIMGGRLASAYARRLASSAVDSLAALQVRTVDLINGEDDTVSSLSDELVHIGDILRILPETMIPTDGVVVKGTSEVNESSITGESASVEKCVGSKLIAGTVNMFGVLHMSVERVPSDNTVADLIHLMREAQDSRLPVQDLSDKVASYLVPVFLALSAVTFLVWVLVGLYVRRESGSNVAVNALKYAMAVMVISCPCAILLAVPMVIVISVAVCAKHGVLFKTIQAIEYVEEISVAVFDKTGTLTDGKLQVVRSHILRGDAMPLVIALTSNSGHPVASAVAIHLLGSPPHGSLSITLQDIQSVSGKGLEATYANLPLRGGNPKWLKAEQPVIGDILAEGLTPFVVMHGEEVIAVFGLADTIRPGSPETIDSFRRRGAEVYIISGDEQTVVNDVAARLGISPEHAFGNCSPKSKQEHVKRLQVASPHRGPSKVAFFGDGTNDSLALVQADIGISFGSGTDVALSAADVVILDPSNMARGIQTFLQVSQGATLRIKVNFVWALVYNVVAVLLAGGAFAHARIPPQYAGLGELVSVIPVIFIAWTMWLHKV